MKSPYVPYMQQQVFERPMGGALNWTRFEVRTIERDSSLLHSVTTVSVAHSMPFIDLSIESYGGKSRRTKYVSVRLEEEAARRLYAALANKFAKTSGSTT